MIRLLDTTNNLIKQFYKNMNLFYIKMLSSSDVEPMLQIRLISNII